MSDTERPSTLVTPKGRTMTWLTTTIENGRTTVKWCGHVGFVEDRGDFILSVAGVWHQEHRTMGEALRTLDARADETVAALLPPGAIVVDAAKLDAIGKAAFVARNDLRERAAKMCRTCNREIGEHFGMRFESIMADVEALRRGTEPVQAIGVIVTTEDRVVELASILVKRVAGDHVSGLARVGAVDALVRDLRAGAKS